jgi:hypothetical protein
MEHPQAKAVSSLLCKLQKRGISLDSVYDGEERIVVDKLNKIGARKTAVEAICGEKERKRRRKTAVEAICAVDVSWVSIKDLASDHKAELFIVLGNDNSEILCDYNASSRTFFSVIDSVSDEFYEQWV